jgi:hypothetical protein
MLKIWFLLILLMLLMGIMFLVMVFLENVGHNFSATRKDPLDGALTQDLLDGPFLFLLCHMLLLLTLFLHNKFRFLLVLLDLKFPRGDL